jgi:hypothetical protein
MLRNATARRHAVSVVALLTVGCTESSTPNAIELRKPQAQPSIRQTDARPGDPNSAAGDTKAFIGAWLNGERVELRYTRSFYCEEPPESVASTGCEIGQLPEEFPRGGRLPTIYALAPVGFTPSDPTTVHCQGCPNHPMMIDVTRLHLPISIAVNPPHSHIVTSRQSGWHYTVNIRVLSSFVWDQIAAHPTLEKVRELQAAFPTQISGDNPTNIFFFFQVHTNFP